MALVAAEAQPGVYFEHEDWELACDNTLTCRAAGYQVDDAVLSLSVLLTREGGPNQAVSGKLMLGSYDDSTWDHLPNVVNLSLYINEQSAGELTMTKPKLTGDLTPGQVTALLDAVVGTSYIEFRYQPARGASTSWYLSDQGASAVLLKMDEFQGRLDTPGALVRKGNRDEASVPPPVPVPVVRAAPLPAPLPGDENFVQNNAAALLDALRPTVSETISEDDDTFCPALIDPEYDWDFGPVEMIMAATRLNDGKMLLRAHCWEAAYNNNGDGYWVINDVAPYAPVLVTTSAIGDEDGAIFSYHWGRGEGDCISEERWTWDGEQFVHTSAYSTGMCKMVTLGGPWTLPTIVTEVK
jgi:hypothetical protein